MKHRDIFNKAYNKLTEIYEEAPDIRILNRFYSEKIILAECNFYIRYLEMIGRLRKIAEQKGEHIWLRGTASSCYIAYLLGVTDLNPLSYDIPFESNIKSEMNDYIQISVSYKFFEEARKFICDEMWDKAIVTLRDSATSPTWLCFLDRYENDDDEYVLSGNTELFNHLPHVTLVPTDALDKYRELENATQVKMKDMRKNDMATELAEIMNGNISDIPNLNSAFIKNIIEQTKPQTYHDMLKIVGFAHGSNVWNDNGEILFDNKKMSFAEIPAYREDLYCMICEKLQVSGIYETGLAYEVMEKARRGYFAQKCGMKKNIADALLSIGFNTDFLSFLERIQYMFPKAHGVAYLEETLTLTWYKTHYKKEFDEVMGNRIEEQPC